MVILIKKVGLLNIVYPIQMHLKKDLDRLCTCLADLARLRTADKDADALQSGSALALKYGLKVELESNTRESKKLPSASGESHTSLVPTPDRMATMVRSSSCNWGTKLHSMVSVIIQ